ncbi:MAG TPA: cellulose biosynthesis cyclic di-GMP-binding regulatory protein BcsB [Paucimonas sp.]|nr:cellulose biosynthesis cyclic di-GMP-binding regulatory protein BcsB [Paucimonas sp.]
MKVPLQKLTALPAIELKCVNGSQSLSIPLPERWNVRSAVLTLRYSVSNNLIGEVSQMTVKMNGEPVAQTKLSPQAPNVEVAIDIPIGLMKSGYNTLSFHVAQHFSRQQCEPPCAPDLWTNISVIDSFLQFEYDLKPLPLKLGAASAMIFDPTQFPEVEVHIVTENLAADSATLATVVASGIARRFDYRKVKFSVSREIRPGIDNVLIGSRNFARKILGGDVQLSEGDGGLLKIFHLPGANGEPDRLHALIAIVDDRLAALKVAASTLANMSLPYPDTDELHAIEFSMPDLSMYSGRHVLASDKPYDFKTLNLSTRTFRGLNAESIELSFRLPADFLIKQNHYAKLSLNFSYGAGLKNNSAINIAVNGKELRAIHLDNASGNFIDGYKVDIPTFVFKPGTNTISFSPSLNTTGGLCETQQYDGLFVTIYENSTLHFPPMPHFVELPKIELFALNGFPFTRWPDGYETLVYLPQQDDVSLATALDIVGMITQRNGFPLFGTQVVYTDPKGWGGEILVVGKVSNIPRKFMEAAPLKLAETSVVPYPTIRSWNAETSIAYSRQRSGLGQGVGVIMQFESPYSLGRSVLVFTAHNDEGLAALGDAILDPGVQGGITGDLVFIDLTNPKYPVTSLRVGKKYTTGNKGDISLIDSFLYANSYVFYIAVAAALFGLVALGYWRLRVFRAKRAGGKPAP